MNYVYKIMQSPVGKLKLIASEGGLAGILWENDKSWRVPHLKSAVENGAWPVLLNTECQLNEYFAGTRKAFVLPLDFTGTDFEKKVWQALLTIPYGETRTYGQIAQQIGETGAARAVGVANSKNPISIIAPCHRVIGADGKLTGFAGGLEVKAYLLNLESNDLFKPTQIGMNAISLV
ncbi:MAG TPA: methylated-DNA--[protein]-cysteine S-methyltransferase [Verrucomicrobiae bacterium]|nr:methylated-DNA--[protein]-cysteine S-methyltransferase [Verrucomicrobiae bacterium]